MVTRPHACFLAGGKFRQLFFPHFSSFLLNAAEPTQVDGNQRYQSGYAGIHTRPPESRAAAQRRLGCKGPPAQSRRRDNSDTVGPAR